MMYRGLGGFHPWGNYTPFCHLPFAMPSVLYKGELSDMIPALCNKFPGWTKEFFSKYWLHEGAALFQIVH